MNYQNYNETIEHFRTLASEKFGHHPEMFEYYAWPQTFGSTAGPFGGIGGQAMSTFTIEALVAGREAILFSSGKLIRYTTKFEPLMRLPG